MTDDLDVLTSFPMLSGLLDRLPQDEVALDDLLAWLPRKQATVREAVRAGRVTPAQALAFEARVTAAMGAVEGLQYVSDPTAQGVRADVELLADHRRRLGHRAVLPHRSSPQGSGREAGTLQGAVPRALVWDGEGAVGRWRGGCR